MNTGESIPEMRKDKINPRLPKPAIDKIPIDEVPPIGLQSEADMLTHKNKQKIINPILRSLKAIVNFVSRRVSGIQIFMDDKPKGIWEGIAELIQILISKLKNNK